MKKFIFVVGVLCAFMLSAFCQKEGNIWCFPDSCGINFNSPAPTTFTSAIGQNVNGVPAGNQSTISDTSGNLFCYAVATDYSVSGLYVYNRNNQVMPNGSNLNGHPHFTCLLLPYPGHDSLVCLFQIGHIGSTDYYPLYFSVINKNFQSGLGDVTLRDSLLYYQELSGHKLTAVRHGNGRDWWVVVYDRDPGEYALFLLSASGVSFHGTQTIGYNGGDTLYYGRIVFSNDGSKLLSVGAAGIIDVFDFDRCTGTISNYRDIGEHLTSQEYQYFSPAFSPNGNMIYVSSFNLKKVLYQWNLQAPNIAASKTLIHEYLDTGLVQWNTYDWHNLAPDGKIYVPLISSYQGPNINNTFTQNLDVIEYPDSVGLACHYVSRAFSLGGHYVAGGLPNMPNYSLGRDTGSSCDSLSAIAQIEMTRGLEAYPNPGHGIFLLKLQDVNDKISEIRILDISNREIYSTKNVLSSIDIRDRSNGLYFVKVQTRKNKFYTVKFIKE